MLLKGWRKADFNPRSSCEERLPSGNARSSARRFQSTLLMRGATSLMPVAVQPFGFQSTLLMRGATAQRLRQRLQAGISIHAPHARSDWGVSNTVNNLYEVFQSTLLMRGATWILGYYGYTKDISIHAPHARSDGTIFARLRPKSNFNPRSSCEERPGMPMTRSVMGRFQSTLLMRGATRLLSSSCSSYRISIHAPHARSDCRLPTSG